MHVMGKGISALQLYSFLIISICSRSFIAKNNTYWLLRVWQPLKILENSKRHISAKDNKERFRVWYDGSWRPKSALRTPLVFFRSFWCLTTFWEWSRSLAILHLLLNELDAKTARRLNLFDRLPPTLPKKYCQNAEHVILFHLTPIRFIFHISYLIF